MTEPAERSARKRPGCLTMIVGWLAVTLLIGVTISLITWVVQALSP